MRAGCTNWFALACKRKQSLLMQANAAQKDGVVQSEPECCGSPAAAGDQKDRITRRMRAQGNRGEKRNTQVSICLSQWSNLFSRWTAGGKSVIITMPVFVTLTKHRCEVSNRIGLWKEMTPCLSILLLSPTSHNKLILLLNCTLWSQSWGSEMGKRRCRSLHCLALLYWRWLSTDSSDS